MRPVERAELLIKTLQGKNPLLQIGGIGVESDGSATLQICSPADGRPIGRCPAGNKHDVDRAFEAARLAHGAGGFSAMAPSDRANLLWRSAEMIEHYGPDLAILESIQTGKTFREASTHDVTSAVAAFRYYAGWVNKKSGELHDLGGGFWGLVQREGYPVVGAILSSSFPLAQAAWKTAAAMAVGSCVILKPSELAPLTVLRLAEVLNKAGAPAGTVNVIPGFGHQAGEAIAEHPHLPVVSFFGSIETARRVLVSSAKSNLKRVNLSLGGKSANIIFEDADLKKAISAAWKAIFTARGEVCAAGSRLLVQKEIYDEACAFMATRAKELLVGDPLDEHTEMGPVISEAQLKRVLSYVDHGRKSGAKLVAGGQRDVDGAKASGYFVKPTVFMDVDPTSRLAQEEIAGPVVCIIPFKNEEEAVEIANGTDYGLASAVWTKQIERAHRVARRLRSGVVWINHSDQIDPALPFGGTALSGNGRDLGREGMEQFSYTKSIYLPSL